MRHVSLMFAGMCLTLAGASMAQGFATDFPPNAVPLSPEQLRERLQDKVFTMQPASGPTMRIEYKGDFGFINIGTNSDSGRWRVEGSSVCNDWRRFPASCSATRLVGDVLYVQRASNKEVLPMTLQR